MNALEIVILVFFIGLLFISMALAVYATYRVIKNPTMFSTWRKREESSEERISIQSGKDLKKVIIATLISVTLLLFVFIMIIIVFYSGR